MRKSNFLQKPTLGGYCEKSITSRKAESVFCKKINQVYKKVTSGQFLQKMSSICQIHLQANFLGFTVCSALVIPNILAILKDGKNRWKNFDSKSIDEPEQRWNPINAEKKNWSDFDGMHEARPFKIRYAKSITYTSTVITSLIGWDSFCNTEPTWNA